MNKYHLQQTYLDDADPFMDILEPSDFSVRSMYHRVKGKISVQLFFGRDMIFLIAHLANWRYMRQIRKRKYINN